MKNIAFNLKIKVESRNDKTNVILKAPDNMDKLLILKILEMCAESVIKTMDGENKWKIRDVGSDDKSLLPKRSGLQGLDMDSGKKKRIKKTA